MTTISNTGLLRRVEGPSAGSSQAVGVRIAALRPLSLSMLALLALTLVLFALPIVAGASHDATWSNTAPAITAASEDGGGGQTWSESPPSIITASAGDGGSSWFNSAPGIVVSSTAQNDPAWSQAVPPQAAAR